MKLPPPFRRERRRQGFCCLLILFAGKRLNVQSPPQLLHPVPADGQGGGGALYPQGEAAVIPGEDILDIFQLDQAGLMDSVKALAIQAALVLGHGGVIGVPLPGQGVNQAAPAGAVGLDIGDVSHVQEDGVPVAADGQPALALGGGGRSGFLQH